MRNLHDALEDLTADPASVYDFKLETALSETETESSQGERVGKNVDCFFAMTKAAPGRVERQKQFRLGSYYDGVLSARCGRRMVTAGQSVYSGLGPEWSRFGGVRQPGEPRTSPEIDGKDTGRPFEKY